MAIIINRKAEQSAPTPKKSSNHTRAKAPVIDLSQDGRLRVAHAIALLGISHSTFYAGLKSGRYPKADGRDGKFPFWHTSTFRPLMGR